MGVYRRSDSKFWWMYLETAPKGRQRVASKVLIGDKSQEGLTRKLAERVYFARMGEIATESIGIAVGPQVITFDVFADWYAEHILPAHRGAVREREILKTLRAGFGPMDLLDIDQPAIIAWRQRRAAKASPSTANREIGFLQQILKAAIPKYLKASPLVGLRRLKTVTPRRRVLSKDEERRLLKVATDPQERALIIVGMDTMMRLGDLVNLRRTDRKGVWLYVAQPKGGHAYEVPLSPRAAAALDAIPNTGEHYFGKFRIRSNASSWRNCVSQRLESLCAAATPPILYGRRKGGITFHWATRRTGATRLLVEKRQSVTVVQQIGNWRKPDVLLAIYSEAQRSDLLRAVGSFTPATRRLKTSAK